MSYAKTIFFIPVWFDDFRTFKKSILETELWDHTSPDKLRPGYLFHYAANIASDSSLFQSFTVKDKGGLNVYMYEGEGHFNGTPIIEDVRLSAFATGVGFMEFHVAYTQMTAEDISNFAYLFKKATKRSGKDLADSKRSLYDVCESLLPSSPTCQLFFSAAAKYKYECNCLHFLHKDDSLPDADIVSCELHRLCRSYNSMMPVSDRGKYDMTYEASCGDYWGGSPEGMVNIVYDYCHDENNSSFYYLHSIKPKHLNVDYYFLYLLLLNQKYSALQYISMVAQVIYKPSKDIENLNKRIIQLKNVFSFNVISDDRHFQNIYSGMFEVLEIKNLILDVIENEKQTELLQNAKHANADRLSNKYLFGISILSLFSALIDSASYFDRIHNIQSISTPLSLACVSLVLVLCITWAIKSIKK